MVRLILIATFISCICVRSVTGQQILRGKILESGNNVNIPYANIILRQNEGTASDLSGNFLLAIRPDLDNGILSISCIGYESKSLSLDSLLAMGEVIHQVFLKPASFLLEEVAIQEKKISPAEIVKEAIIAISRNYRQEPFNMEFYSRITTGSVNTSNYLVETIVKTYRLGYKEGGQNFSRITQKRVTGINPLPKYDKKRKLEYFAYENLPGFDVFVIDMIGSTTLPNTVFNPDYFKRLEFRHLENTRFEKDTVFVIEYDANGFKQEGERSFRGKLYISTRTLAILRHERSIGRNYLAVIYRPMDGYYFPYFIKSIYKAQGASAIDVTHEAYITKIITQNPDIISTHPDQKNWHLDDVAFDINFWETNYPVKN